MSLIHDEFDAAIRESETLRKSLKRSKTRQVNSGDERSLAKATALAWFKNHRPRLRSNFDEDALATIDGLYRRILEASQKAATRTGYDVLLKLATKELIRLQSENVVGLSLGSQTKSLDTAPDFSPLISDSKMQAILRRRWEECVQCIESGASLAAIVMMGGLLEGLLLSRIHRESDKAPIFKASTAPIDKTGKTRPLNEWVLKNYLDVTHEMGWITPSAKSVGEVLRDYRNYIHPHKELSLSKSIQAADVTLLWEISKNISRQIIGSIS